MTCILAVIGWLFDFWHLPYRALWFQALFVRSLLTKPLAERDVRRRLMIASEGRARCHLGISRCTQCSGTGTIGRGIAQRACPCTYALAP